MFFVVTWLVYPALTLAFVALPPLAVMLVLLLAVGVVTGAYDPFEVTVHQLLIPPDLRARAFDPARRGDDGRPASMLLYGLLIEQAGLRVALLLFALGNVALGAYAILNEPARTALPRVQLRRTREEAA